jgi:hypothetical protein
MACSEAQLRLDFHSSRGRAEGAGDRNRVTEEETETETEGGSEEEGRGLRAEGDTCKRPVKRLKKGIMATIVFERTNSQRPVSAHRKQDYDEDFTSHNILKNNAEPMCLQAIVCH